MSDEVKPCEYCQGVGHRDILHRGTNELHRVRCACLAKDLPCRFVYQPENSGCMVAAAAMILGKTYFETKQYFSVVNDFSCTGTYIQNVHDLFDTLGYSWVTRYSTHSRLGGVDRAEWPSKPWADMIFCEVINTRGSGMHAVVLLRDGRVLDPWWGVLQGLHRYPRVSSMTSFHKREEVSVANV